MCQFTHKLLKLFFLFYIGIKKERFLNLSCNYLERTLISPYISDRNATEPRDTILAICSAPISLYVSATTVTWPNRCREFPQVPHTLQSTPRYLVTWICASCSAAALSICFLMIVSVFI